MHHVAAFGEVEEAAYLEAGLYLLVGLAADAADGKLKRVGLGGGAELGPGTGSVGIDGAHLHGVGRLGCQIGKRERELADVGVEQRVEHDLVGVGSLYGFPYGRETVGAYRVGRNGGLGSA